ncbi:MAG: hypothetical protein E6Q97_14485 [Desulfurellales bacterium]|nr:MAG: hypothetical protein E6Q97_14485 [Desulfurellales bacterium]
MSEASLSPSNRDHLDRVKSAVLQQFTLKKVPRWIETRTFLEGAPFSFKHHEYQLKLLEEESNELNIKKCSQVGISEVAVRRTLAILDILNDIHAIYTLPTASFAKTFVKSRFDPVIEGSKYLRGRLNSKIDSFEMKQLGSSFLYIKGTIGQAAAISVPASLLVHDEVDFSDQTVLSSYHSRLTHSKYKLRMNLSTPTVPGFGIDERMQNSKQHYNFCKCCHCSQWFLPDYFDHVKIPGYTGDLREITKENLHTVDYLSARLICPHCGKEPNLDPENRGWVVKNPDEARTAGGYQVSPFDAPRIIKPSDLIHSGTQYKRYVDFINFNLGQCAEDKENALTREELEDLWHQGETPRFTRFALGIDVGLVLHFTLGAVADDGTFVITHLERVPLAQFWDRLFALMSRFYIEKIVIDSMPYADLVLTLQQRFERAYASVYVRSRSPELFNMVDQTEDPEKLKNTLRAVNVNRDMAFDSLMADSRRGKLAVMAGPCQEEKEVWLKHLTDMRRVQKFDANDELYFHWEKSSKGVDHYHHSTLYFYIACQMLGFGPVEMPYTNLLTKFKHRSTQ